MTERRHRRWVPPFWILLPVIAVMMAGIAVGAVLVTNALIREQDNKRAVGAVAVEQAVTIEQLCNAGGEVAAALESAGQCAKSREVQNTVKSAGASPESVTVVATPDRAELMKFVRTAVAAYCANRNDCRPDTALLIATVADYLQANPPEPGRAPTTEEITSAARSVLTSDPELFQGVPGVAGAQGPGPTDEQVLGAVEAFCGAREDCRGVQGPQGIGVMSVFFERNGDGVCEAVVTYRDPATDQSVTDRRPAGDSACPALPGDGGLLPGG